MRAAHCASCHSGPVMVLICRFWLGPLFSRGSAQVGVTCLRHQNSTVAVCVSDSPFVRLPLDILALISDFTQSTHLSQLCTYTRALLRWRHVSIGTDVDPLQSAFDAVRYCVPRDSGQTGPKARHRNVARANMALMSGVGKRWGRGGQSRHHSTRRREEKRLHLDLQNNGDLANGPKCVFLCRVYRISVAILK